MTELSANEDSVKLYKIWNFVDGDFFKTQVYMS